MVQIDDVVLALDVFTQKFVCDLGACRGECCVEGDAGAPAGHLVLDRPRRQTVDENAESDHEQEKERVHQEEYMHEQHSASVSQRHFRSLPAARSARALSM